MSYKPDYQYLPPVNWSILTPFYDFLCTISGLGAGFKKKVLNAVALRDGMTVADIGCGTGVFLQVAKQQYPKVRFIGFDPDQKALAIANRRLVQAHADTKLVEAFAESLPLPDQCLDVAFSTLAFHHLPDRIKQAAIWEISRVLKPGGLVVIADFGPTQSRLLRKILFFEKLEYLEGNLQGVILQYLQEANFKNTRVVRRQFPGIAVVVAEK
jgi:ubiquinone/menaquinone biosynthesis C-methylase UbiE